MEIQLQKINFQHNNSTLDIDDWKIAKRQSWALFSSEGNIAELLADLLNGNLQEHIGDQPVFSGKAVLVSLAQQQRLLEDEIARDDSDFLDLVDQGSSVYTLIYQQCHDQATTVQLLHELDLAHLSESGFRVLSTGETRRVMLARAVASKPDLLLLDNPFTGLDIAHRKALAEYLKQLSSSVAMFVTFSREEDQPEWIDNIALFNSGKLMTTMNRDRWNNHPVIKQLKAQSNLQSEDMLTLIEKYRHSSHFDDPIFEIKNGKVAYTESVIFSELTWRIDKGQHWQIKGPNGCGKSTLLGLIFGDHPQCYSNNIHIFGKQRGSGESIWQIKQHIGMVSSALHLQYRVNCTAVEVILSGFYDSIGLYKQSSRQEVNIAHEWLEILHMSQYSKTSFRELEYGQQRLLLIARAIVKQPTLLILDEPYQGLDYLNRRLIKNALQLIARENLSQLLYVSHYQSDSLASIEHHLEFVFDPQSGGYKAQLSHS